MRKPIYKSITMTSHNDQYIGQSVEEYVREAETTKQPIEGGAPEIFTPRKDGIKPETNIRTDRWEIAQKAMNLVAKSYRAKRADWIKSQSQPPSTNQSNTTSAETA